MKKWVGHECKSDTDPYIYEQREFFEKAQLVVNYTFSQFLMKPNMVTLTEWAQNDSFTILSADYIEPTHTNSTQNLILLLTKIISISLGFHFLPTSPERPLITGKGILSILRYVKPRVFSR